MTVSGSAAKAARPATAAATSAAVASPAPVIASAPASSVDTISGLIPPAEATSWTSRSSGPGMPARRKYRYSLRPSMASPPFSSQTRASMRRQKSTASSGGWEKMPS